MAHLWTLQLSSKCFTHLDVYRIITQYLPRTYGMWDCSLALKYFLNFRDRKTKSEENESFTVTTETTGGVKITKILILPTTLLQPRALSLRLYTFPIEFIFSKVFKNLYLFIASVFLYLLVVTQQIHIVTGIEVNKLYYKAGLGFAHKTA